MSYDFEHPELEAALGRARTLPELDQALNRVAALVPTFKDPQVWGRKLFAPRLDALAPTLARRLNLADVPVAKSNDNICILATRFYDTGGHGRVAADICRLHGAERTTIVLTDIFRQLSYSQLLGGLPEGFACRALNILSARTTAEKILELYWLLKAIQPTRIYLLQNHMDMVAVVSAWPFRDVVEFVHHGDYLPSLGATLPFSTHADLTYTCHPACHERLPGAVYVGMSVDGGLEKAERLRPERAMGRRRFATCGSLHKYRGEAAYRWTDFVIAALETGDSEFMHVGPVDDAFEAEVRGALLDAALDPARYRFLGPTPDLHAALLQHEIDIYVSSYPVGGGRTIHEALAAGIPVLVLESEDLGPFIRFDLPLRGWRRIAAPNEMAQAVDAALAEADALRGEAFNAELVDELTRFDRYVLGPADAADVKVKA